MCVCVCVCVCVYTRFAESERRIMKYHTLYWSSLKSLLNSKVVSTDGGSKYMYHMIDCAQAQIPFGKTENSIKLDL